MHKVVMAFAEGSAQVGEVRVWCSYSRSPEERRRASHASMLKRLSQEHYPHHVERLDLEYSTGTAWLGDSRVCSAVDARPDGPPQEYYVVVTKPERPWVHVAALARELGVGVEPLRAKLVDVDR